MLVYTNFLRSITLSLLVVGATLSVFAQRPEANGGTRPQGNTAAMKIGRFYGKIVDDATGKGIAYASIQLVGMQWDSISQSMKSGIIGGQLTEENGEFSLESLPIMGEFTLKINYLGYATEERKVSFGRPGGSGAGGGRPGGGGGRPGGGGMGGAVEKDLGNIRLLLSAQVLQEVEIRGEASKVVLALDKKIYRVDKDNIAAGGTAEDALKNVPSLNVDIDGNLTMRNAAPQLFVDGRPTPLSLDQIPADAIDNVEIITNPSAKYDASGGQAGIVNIVLKKNRRFGYNGTVRAGVDIRPRMNLGADLNVREGKFNAFIGGNLNQRKNLVEANTERFNLQGAKPLTDINQVSDAINQGFFASGRGGVDWFINNRNTLTFSGNYHTGVFDNSEDIGFRNTIKDSIPSETNAVRLVDSERHFGNLGTQLLFKHLFPKEGKEWTADVNYNRSRNNNNAIFDTNNPPLYQKQNGSGGNSLITAQTDFVTPLASGIKLETGARIALRDFYTENANFLRDSLGNFYRIASGLSDRYKFHDEVYALYGTFSKSYKRFGYQVGLRVESSRYVGTLTDIVAPPFKNQYPFSPFPSLFLTYKVNEEDNIQINYSRRINRPNFFQLIPFTDFTDPLNLSRGNPDLVPEFTNSLELSYQNIFNKKHNLLTSLYFKKATDLLTRYQVITFDTTLKSDVILNTYQNANSSTAYGVELTLKNAFGTMLELTSNLNFYNSILNSENIENALTREQFTWFIKENLSLKLPKQFTFQANGSYQSRTAFDTGGGGRGGGGHGGGWGGGPSNTAQGYTIPVWFVDMSIRKDFWKRTASITLSVQDIFRSRRTGSHAETSFFIQDSWRRRDPQLVRLNFSYRFGKFDVSLFRRKNTKSDMEGMEF